MKILICMWKVILSRLSVKSNGNDVSKYLNLIPHIFEDNSSTGYNEVWTFVINFDEAEKYRKLRGGFLRKNQWRDLTVHVFVWKKGDGVTVPIRLILLAILVLIWYYITNKVICRQGRTSHIRGATNSVVILTQLLYIVYGGSFCYNISCSSSGKWTVCKKVKKAVSIKIEHFFYRLKLWNWKNFLHRLFALQSNTFVQANIRNPRTDK